MKTPFLILFAFLLLSFATHAQQSSTQQEARAESARLMDLYHKLEGTYQVQVIDSREKVGFPLTLLDSIQSQRKENETVYLWLKHNIRVMIRPRTEIEKKDFVPLPQTAYYSSDNLPNK